VREREARSAWPSQPPRALGNSTTPPSVSVLVPPDVEGEARVVRNGGRERWAVRKKGDCGGGGGRHRENGARVSHPLLCRC